MDFPNGYRNDTQFPVYKTGKQAFTSKEVVEVLLKPPQGRICSKKPTFIDHDVAYIFDLARLADAKDVTADGNGTYIQHGVPPEHCYVATEDLVASRTSLSDDELVAKGIEDPTDYCILTHQYVKLKSSPDFQRVIMKLSLLTSHGDNKHRYCLVQYHFTGSRHKLPDAEKDGRIYPFSKFHRAATQ